MRRFLSIFITSFVLISCNTDQGDLYTLNGHAYGFADGTKVYVMEIDEHNQSKPFDTLEISSEKFTAKYPKGTETELQILRVEGIGGNVVFFAESEDLTANLYKDSIGASFVAGGRQNELYRTYNEEVGKINQRRVQIAEAYKKAQVEQDGIMINELRSENVRLSAQEKSFKKQFVQENSNSYFGLMLLSEMFNRNEITGPEATALLDKLSPKLNSNDLATKLKTSIEAKKKADVGGMAPDFEAPSPDGSVVSLKDAMGKYTIIDFWASWCRPCRIENPNVVNVYNKYHDKGLNIISVSLDKPGQKDRWVKAIADDKMDWYHVSNLRFWQDPIARQYNVRSIPATFLLDEEGRIIDKNLRGAALQKKIASLMD